MAPSGGHTQSEGDSLDLLLVTHFPSSVVIERETVPAAVRRTTHLDRWVAVRVVTYGRVVSAIDSFAPSKSPGMDRKFRALLQKGQKHLVPYLVKIFLPAWQLAMFQPYGARLR
jgi:hypothetical protein